MELDKLKFPRYDGNETQNEHIIYTYLGKVLKNKGYLIKIKKTNFSNIDKNIVSYKGKGLGSCDAYIMSGNEDTKLCALLELESTGNLNKKEKGIDQLRSYANGLKDAYSYKRYRTDFIDIYLIGYDGNKIWVSQYNLISGNENILIGDHEDGKEITDELKLKLLDLFKAKHQIELDEKTLIRKAKNILRGDKNLQGNKAFILTVLASIYGNTSKETIEEALSLLENLSSNSKDSEKILEKWNEISRNIGYSKEGNNEIKSKISMLYSSIAKRLYIISQDKQIDLYGYIYEELAEKINKKEDGEYYTPRTHIYAIINSVFNKYLLKKWKLNNDKYQSQEKILEKHITDPFCGSGGFLYVFLKILKQKYDFDMIELNEISSSSIWGMDKNEVTSAYFNLFLVGDGEANLKKVVTTINWQNAWKYKVISKGDSQNIKKIESKGELIKNIESFRSTFIVMLRNLIDMNLMKTMFSLKTQYARINDIETFISKYESERKKHDNEFFFFNDLIKQEYKSSDEPVLELLYDVFKYCSNNIKNIDTFEVFKSSLGAVDFLPTNVPYGNLDDIRFKGKIGKRLESQALIECIDLLRPSSIREDGDNGDLISNNDGGVGTIIIPSGIFEREEEDLRSYILKRCNILSIIKLPPYTFSPYASIETYALTIRKKAVFEFNSESQGNNKVFMYIIDNDGKANSDKRYDTHLINSERTEIISKDSEYVTCVYEYIHNEIDVNLEKYPEGYFSKLERCWIHGNTSKYVNEDWNQIRYNQIWDGEKWGIEPGSKWKYCFLEKKKYYKQVEKKKKNLIEIAKKINEKNELFDSLDIDEQKDLMIDQMKREYLQIIRYIEVKKEKICLRKENGRSIMNNILREYTKEYYTGRDEDISLNDSDEEFVEFIESVINSNVDVYSAACKKEIEYLEKNIDLIYIYEDNLKLYQTEEYEEYDLVIENYLIPEKKLEKKDIINNLNRLKQIRGENNYNINETKVEEVLEEIYELDTNREIKLEKFIESYIERGIRLTEADIYNGYGNIPVYSSTISGPIGYYNKANYKLNDKSIIYTIEGNAGYILKPKDKEIFYTDVAGIINIKEEYYDKYNIFAIAIYLQYLFIKNRHNTGKQPKFLVKRNLNMKINLDVLDKLSKLISQIEI